MEMGSEKEKGKRPSEAPTLQSELNEIWSLTLVSETARMRPPIYYLGSGGVVASTRGELYSDIKD